MRLCRFCVGDEEPLIGFYEDDAVIPIDQAAEAHHEATGVELALPVTEDLLDLLPPDGPGFSPARILWRWLSVQTRDVLETLAIPLDEVELCVPVPRPPKLLLLAGNYAEHIREQGGVAAERAATFPYVFMKPPSTTLTHPGRPIVIPGVSPDHVDWECELGVVIGRACRDVDEAVALDYVAGYTVINDVSDRKYQPNPERQPRERDRFFDWLHGKWHDTFCPMGPCLRSADSVPDPQALGLRLSVNGETKQDGRTGQMIFPVAAIVAFLSRWVTLEPGDVIATGTPAGVGNATGQYLKPGDVVVAEIEGIGRLENPVEAEG
jgi:2-keto-4-pentenoate hydratase/2-oxohepta-3-ene-1,7-dioic acid hydratase in catechol pathway